MTVREEGTKISFSVRRADDHKGLYKVWIAGEKGNQMLLGTLSPEHGMLGISRTFSRTALEQEGCWPVLAGECHMSYPFTPERELQRGEWCWRNDVERLFCDSVLKVAAHRTEKALYRRCGDGFQLAIPFEWDRPFPFIPVFCFARIQSVMGRCCALWQFNEEGLPQTQDLFE